MKKKIHFGKGKMPNRYQRAGIVKNGLDPYQYLVVKETPECLYIKHKDTEKIQTIRY